MPLQYVKIPESFLGSINYVQLVETVMKDSNGRGRRRRARKEAEIISLTSDKVGSFMVRVPTAGALVGDFFKKKVRLVNPRIEIEAVPGVTGDGEVIARPSKLLIAEKIELVGGQNG